MTADLITDAVLIAVVVNTAVIIGHVLVYLRDRRKADIEAAQVRVLRQKATADIQHHEDESALRTQEIMTNQFATLVKAMGEREEKLIKEIRRLEKRVDTLTKHVDVLRAALVQQGVAPPPENESGSD